MNAKEMKRFEIFARVQRKEISLQKAAELLDLSYRQVRRLWKRFQQQGKEGLRQVLEPLYEPKFHGSSHGFRPERSCHTAVREAVEHVKAGFRWVVDLDLEKFFDKVCHQRLLSKLGEQVRES